MQLFGQTIPIPDTIRRVKIDVGLGMHNVQSIQWLKHDRDLFVFMFEPNPVCIESCVGRMCEEGPTFSANGNEVCILPFAVADVSGVVDMPFYAMWVDGGTSSLFLPTDPTLGLIAGLHVVQACPLRLLFEAFPWDRIPWIDYLKVDVQGGDLAVLRSAGPWLAERVVYVTAEPESTAYAGCEGNTEEAITAYMTAQGFERIVHSNTCDPTFVNLRFKGEVADAVYIYQQN